MGHYEKWQQMILRIMFLDVHYNYQQQFNVSSFTFIWVHLVQNVFLLPLIWLWLWYVIKVIGFFETLFHSSIHYFIIYDVNKKIWNIFQDGYLKKDKDKERSGTKTKKEEKLGIVEVGYLKRGPSYHG